MMVAVTKVRGVELVNPSVACVCVVMQIHVFQVDKLGGYVEDVISTLEKQLAVHGVMSENLGGDVQLVPVSAVSGEGLR